MSSDDFDFDDDFFGDDDDDFGLDNLRDDDAGGFDDFDDADDDDAGDFGDFDDFDSDDDSTFFGEDDEDDGFSTLEDYDEGFFEEEEEREASGGPSRTFIYIAAAMFVFFLIGILLIVFLVLRGDPGDADAEATALAFNTQAASIQQTNEAVLGQLDMTNTQTVLDQTQAVLDMTIDAQSTIDAANAQATASVEAINAQLTADSQTLTAQPTNTPLVDLTAQAEQQTQDAILALTQNAGNVTPTEMVTSEPVDADAVGLTATALARILETPISQATPTREGGAVVATAIPNIGGGELPETGLSVDFASGQGLPMVALIAFGLVGVIFGARRLRTMNNEPAKK